MVWIRGQVKSWLADSERWASLYISPKFSKSFWRRYYALREEGSSADDALRLADHWATEETMSPRWGKAGDGDRPSNST